MDPTTVSFFSTVTSGNASSVTSFVTITTDETIKRDNVTTARTTLITTAITILPTNGTTFNATEPPELDFEVAGMGMGLVPFGIITVIGLALAGRRTG
ncbi:hypothetical protein DPEC_G00205030 [Dallia pectoralis]|uniref:Uncharacterized protein n=1 Tax=Dallia pectoralis TaxID=75939 RepID=A0ACC2G4H4_DALPE|nr:hypothetical protein DPEC_G00205030 [Dallia pectoralis]